jgi:pimeloyl-ACP methyl ester carboxylesterase
VAAVGHCEVVREELDITARSGRVHAQRFGSCAAPLVLGLHGLSGNMKHFDFLGEHLGGDALQLVALDLRGRGNSQTTPPGTYGWKNHALDVLAVADALGFERFSVVGQSMGGSVAIEAAELDRRRLDAIVLLDVAGRVDPGVGAVIASVISGLDEVHPSVEGYLAAVKAQGTIEPWSEHWDRCHRYGLEEVDGGVRSSVRREAVAEDRRYTLTQDPYDRWKHLTMPTLLLRATQELRPGAGYVVPADDRDRFLREVPRSAVVEIDANHLTITTHPHAAAAIRRFLTDLPDLPDPPGR